MNHGKTSIFALLILFFFCTVEASFGFDFAFGFRSGLVMPLGYGSQYKTALASAGLNKAFIAGYTGGAFFTLGLVKLLALQPEINFSHLGYAVKDSSNTRTKLLYSSVMIPFLLKFRIHFKKGNLGIFSGPNLIIKTAKDEEYEPGVQVAYETFNPFTFGLVFGIDYNIPIGYAFINIDFRYDLNLINIYHKNYVSDADNLKQMAFAFTLGAGIKTWRDPKPEKNKAEEKPGQERAAE